jgi:hypothetical protein
MLFLLTMRRKLNFGYVLSTCEKNNSYVHTYARFIHWMFCSCPCVTLSDKRFCSSNHVNVGFNQLVKLANKMRHSICQNISPACRFYFTCANLFERYHFNLIKCYTPTYALALALDKSHFKFWFVRLCLWDDIKLFFSNSSGRSTFIHTSV